MCFHFVYIIDKLEHSWDAVSDSETPRFLQTLLFCLCLHLSLPLMCLCTVADSILPTRVCFEHITGPEAFGVRETVTTRVSTS